MTNLQIIVSLVEKEMQFAENRYGEYKNAHELYAVLLEEVEEYWDSVKQNKEDYYELLQVVAVGLRYLLQKIHISDIMKSQEKRWDANDIFGDYFKHVMEEVNKHA